MTVQSLIEKVLQVTLNSQDVPSGFYYYPNLENPSTVGLTIDDIDSIILFQLTENMDLLDPLNYINDSFRRCSSEKKFISKSSNPSNESIPVLNEIERLLIGYGLVSFQIESFCLKGNYLNYIETILNNLDSFSDLLLNIIKRSIEENSSFELINNFFNTLLTYSMKINLNLNDNKNYNAILSVFEMFLNFKQISSIFSQIENYLPDLDSNNPLIKNPCDYEKNIILGPILSLSPLDTNVAFKNFQNEIDFTQDPQLDPSMKQKIKLINESLQTEHKVIIDRLFYILDKIFRGSNKTRSDTISLLSIIVNKNHLRRGENANPKKLSSNAFMTNITILLIKFSQPFLDVSFKKIDKIDVNYFNNINLLIDLSNETRMNSDYNEANEFYETKNVSTEPNFISNCFFLTLTYLHYGLGGTLLTNDKLSSQIKSIKEEVKRLKNLNVTNGQNSQNFLNSFTDLQIKNMEKSLFLLQSINQSLIGFFTNKSLQLEIFDFISGASTFLIRVIDPNHDFPFNSIKLPLIPDQIGFENVDNADYLRKNAPIPFKYYPEFIVEGILNYNLFITKFNNNPLFNNPRLNSFIELMTILLRCPELISNPHLKVKIVQILSYGSMPLMDNSPGFMMEIFENNEIVNKNILYALLDFYVIVEKTGSSSQFYDKFNARYSISIILEQLYYHIPIYKTQLKDQAKNNSNFFIRFVARMLNDLTFLLDEGLSNLTEVHNITQEILNRSKGNPPSREENDDELKSKLNSASRQAKSSCGLAAKSIILFKMYTKDIPNAFVSAEIVDRLASMLDYNLASLVGPKCNDLKVKDPQSYSFNAKQLLYSLVTIYLNLSKEDEFVKAVARDGRSYNKSLFDRAIHILHVKTGLASDEYCNKLINFVNKVEIQKVNEEEEDQDYNDAPDEFLDPLMYTIMKDPVILPTSHVSIDLSTIKAHLLSDSTDPFNREPLTLDQVTPNVELKNQILAYKKKKREEKLMKRE
ncbi:hypothetical protein TBLA_0F02090 [Henningerozyma blattae CBS 6284]|uniref:RING-type E3 ubiquitin transferase n=1 Tax=Henningerozyma blattae (strain ATCC 34711 / CBS 6284 / DSM 70876 / NBRC 10599 / NRRL Y-10934 / UCD 77-7) TaxID=1071380 RepID=I2H5U9_HENB6|nr:hypothetical protein TBLA_0F02090 [Tetrapisispora blattae CBS 6284]CCH61751.1 hypothetical protein TBLA_0F02090 [Tetrapisispora blattae CBS 6284]